jgi:hypothetical protein
MDFGGIEEHQILYAIQASVLHGDTGLSVDLHNNLHAGILDIDGIFDEAILDLGVAPPYKKSAPGSYTPVKV